MCLNDEIHLTNKQTAADCKSYERRYSQPKQCCFSVVTRTGKDLY